MTTEPVPHQDLLALETTNDCPCHHFRFLRREMSAPPAGGEIHFDVFYCERCLFYTKIVYMKRGMDSGGQWVVTYFRVELGAA